MIEFNGKLTGNAKEYLLQKQVALQTKVSMVLFVVFGIPITLAAIFASYYMLLLFLIPLVLYFIFSTKKPSEKDQKIFMPKRIYIDLEEETIVHECEKMERFHMIHDVKEVLDYGEWYHIIFVYESRDMYFVCQKDLLTQGTIEEFEALFEGKITRVNE